MIRRAVRSMQSLPRGSRQAVNPSLNTGGVQAWRTLAWNSDGEHQTGEQDYSAAARGSVA